jgi:hypothetical protein
MQYIDNDMDDLFRRAAESYPLDAGKSGWEGVLEKISNERDEPVTSLQPGKKNYKKIILITVVLLVAVSIFQKVYYRPTDNIQNATAKVYDVKDQPGNSIFEKRNTITTGNDCWIIQAKKTTGGLFSPLQPITTKSFAQAERDEKKAALLHTAANTNMMISNGSVDEGFYIKDRILIDSLKLLPGNLQLHMDQRKLYLPEVFTGAAGQITGTAKKGNVKIKKDPGIYIGLSTGLDFSKGASMSFSNSGLDAGILVGYRFGNSLSIESGISKVKKNYESRGRNFNMDKIGSTMPAGMVINNLQSSSDMIEIPLKVKYDFYKRRESVLFVTGGVSSYIITREFNQYDASLNGQPEKLTGMYKKKSYEVPAAAVVSAGYQHAVSSKINIRIEPFLKIPLQGIGVGNLPVTSAGLQFTLSGHIR